jgi:hypothetical protein
MIHYIAVLTFLLIVGVCLYVVLNSDSYSALVLCLASLVLCVATRAVAPVWRFYLSGPNRNHRKRQSRAGV